MRAPQRVKFFCLLCTFKKVKSAASQILDHKEVYEIMENPEKLSSPWYGQLMGAAQIMAYIIQLDFWLTKYNINLEI